MTRPASPADFSRVLGHSSLTGLYDAAIAVMARETVWRTTLLAQLAPHDGGWQRTPSMRLLFRQVQALEKVENTRLNAAGGLPDPISETGFEGVGERPGVSPTRPC